MLLAQTDISRIYGKYLGLLSLRPYWVRSKIQLAINCITDRLKYSSIMHTVHHLKKINSVDTPPIVEYLIQEVLVLSK